ncbi:MAG: hypothetical protein AB8B56_01065 [Crocinitomicaceae bacterium]
MTKSLFIILITALFLGCENSSQANLSDLEGLWIVQSVKVGDSEMTPNARWTRFHSDSTFESGNGKFQHSYGTWKLDEKSNKLSFNTENGLEDIYEAFKLTISSDKMTWERTEDGEQITVELVRSDKLPATHGDKLVGLWDLKTSKGSGTYFEASDEVNTSDYLYFRWDNRFILNSVKGRITGIYQAHGHRSEVLLIPDNDLLKRTRWELIITDSEMALKELNTDSTRIRQFTRIHQFPD